jgi:hypothetical protein
MENGYLVTELAHVSQGNILIPSGHHVIFGQDNLAVV